MVAVLAVLACGGGAVGMALFGPDPDAPKKPKRPPVTEEWTGPAPRPAPKPADPDKPKDPDGPKDPPRGKPDPPKELHGLLPPAAPAGGAGTAPAGKLPPKPPATVTGRDDAVVVRLQNARRVFGTADADNIEVDYEVLRIGFAILHDTAIVLTPSGATGFKVSAPGKTGTLTIPGAVPARTTGTVELWIVLRRNGQDLTSNAVTVK
jgi:hypothetical protein